MRASCALWQSDEVDTFVEISSPLYFFTSSMFSGRIFAQFYLSEHVDATYHVGYSTICHDPFETLCSSPDVRWCVRKRFSAVTEQEQVLNYSAENDLLVFLQKKFDPAVDFSCIRCLLMLVSRPFRIDRLLVST